VVWGKDLGFSPLVAINLPVEQSQFAGKLWESSLPTPVVLHESSWEVVQSWPGEEFACISVLDAFYHFRSQRRAIQEFARLLRPGGICLITDIAFPGLQKSFHPVLSFLTGIAQIPAENLGDQEKNVLYLKEAGLEVLQVQDWSSFVFPGFAKFSKDLFFLLKIFAEKLEEWYKQGKLTYHLYVARKP